LKYKSQNNFELHVIPSKLIWKWKADSKVEGD
jgi:hypothetical protein